MAPHSPVDHNLEVTRLSMQELKYEYQKLCEHDIVKQQLKIYETI